MVKEKERKYESILNIAPEKAQSTYGKCICDNCGAEFDPDEVLMENCDNLDFQGILRVKGITKDKKTWYMVSPCCKTTHLYGFDIKENTY